MPKQTFLNLPEEKRQAVVDAAIDEFADYGFEGFVHQSHCGKQRNLEGQFLSILRRQDGCFQVLDGFARKRKDRVFQR